MNAVLGISHLLAKTPLSPDQQSYVNMIRSAGAALLDIIDDILDFSKVEAGKLDIVMAPFAINEIVDVLTSTMTANAGAKDLELLLEVAANVPAALVGDAPRLRQALLNLVSNAIKFTERGKVRVLIEQIARCGDEVTLRFIVRDTGIGMDADQLARIFTPFEQADTSTSRRFGGTGLGLAISRRLVELMRGTITVSSQLGVGSEFCLTLPLLLAAANGDAQMPVPRAPPAHLSAIRLDGVRLLLVEDNALNQVVARGMLEAAGAAVKVAHNGQEAVALVGAAKRRYDLILMDVQMPVMDGYVATRIMRKELGVSTPILAMSAGVMVSERERCLAAGMDDFIPKPIDHDRMLATIARALRLGVGAPGRADGVVAARAYHFPEGVFDMATLLGLSVEDGPQRALLIALVARMAEQAPLELALARGAWDAGDASGAARALHALRGAVGSLGASRFASLALTLEGAILDNASEEIAALFELASREMHATASAAQAWLALQKPAPMRAMDAEPLQEKFERWIALLREQNLDAIEEYAAIRERLAQLLSEDQLAGLDGAMSGLDFPAALSIFAGLPPESRVSMSVINVGLNSANTMDAKR